MIDHGQKLKHGLILLDKPAGITSRQCVTRIQNLFHRIKAGHAGTLDPFATGLLPVCMGRATKFVERLRMGKKSYEAELLLGIGTATQDITGEITAQKEVPTEITIDHLKSAASKMVGIQEQIPPMFSAKKIKGKRLYELARQNIVVKRKPVTIEISRFEILDYISSIVRFRVDCSEGTYVRTLGADLAASLNLPGSLKTLRRLKVGRFNVEDSVELTKLETGQETVEDWFLSADSITDDLRKVIISSVSEHKFRNGIVMNCRDFQKIPEMIASDEEFNVYDEDSKFLGLAIACRSENQEDCTLKTRRLIDIR